MIQHNTTYTHARDASNETHTFTRTNNLKTE